MQTRFLSLRRLVLAGATTLLLAAAPGRAHAAFVLTLQQTANSVTISGSGALNLSALTLIQTSTVNNAYSSPSSGITTVGINGAAADRYSGITGPSRFGSGGVTQSSAGTGDLVGVFGTSLQLRVPTGYVSGTMLLGTATFNGATFTSLGFTPGTYSYNWGTGATADSLTVTSVASVVPEPSTWALLGLGGVGLGLTLRGRRRAVRLA